MQECLECFIMSCLLEARERECMDGIKQFRAIGGGWYGPVQTL